MLLEARESDYLIICKIYLKYEKYLSQKYISEVGLANYLLYSCTLNSSIIVEMIKAFNVEMGRDFIRAIF